MSIRPSFFLYATDNAYYFGVRFKMLKLRTKDEKQQQQQQQNRKKLKENVHAERK